MKVFRYMVSSDDRQEQGYTDNREETVVRSGEGQRGARKLLLGYRMCREGGGIHGKVIPGKAREFGCHRVICLTESYCER